MPATIPHFRITARFDLGTSASPELEEATCTLAFKRDTALSASGRQDYVDDAFADWAAFVIDGSAKISNTVLLRECRLYHIDNTGHIDEDPAISTGEPVRGIAAGPYHPYQCSTVVTLVAGVRGKGRLGRIFLPPSCLPIGQDGSIASGPHSDAVGSVATLLNALGNAPALDVGWGLVVAGHTGTGTLRDVTSFRVGRVMDTQRRRRRSLPEAYVSQDLS